MEYEKCLVELDEILKYLDKVELEKIPIEIRKAISENKDKKYVWKYDESKALTEQCLSRKTIALLAYLNMEYLLNDEQKSYMEKLHKYNEENDEIEKLKKYNPDDLFSNNRVESKEKDTELIEIKNETWYVKLKSFFIKFFKRN